MKNKFFKQKSFYAVFLSVVLSVVLVAGAAGAVTTISTNISTGGTLSVTGASTFSDNGTFIGNRVNLGSPNGSAAAQDDRVYLYGTTTVVGAQSLVFGSSTAESLSGQQAGAVYFDSTNRVLRLYDGVNWYPVASSTDAAGSLIIGAGTKLVRFNIIETAHMALGTTTTQLFETAGPAVLTIQATSSSETALRIYATSTFSQSGDIFQILSSSAAELFVIDGLGHASTTSSLSVGSTGNNNNANLYVGGFATTTGSNGNFAAQGTLTIDGHALLRSSASTTVFTVGANRVSNGFLYIGGNATTTGSTGNFATEGNASSTSLNVGGMGTQTTLNGLIAGFCTMEQGNFVIAASSTRTYPCINNLVRRNDRVLVMATSTSLSVEEDGSTTTEEQLFSDTFIILAATASSTHGYIDLRIHNIGASAGTTTLGAQSFNFWAFR